MEEFPPSFCLGDDIMSLLDKVKEFAESEEVQKGIQKVKENTEEILSEENVNKCVNRAKEAATTISEAARHATAFLM